MYKYGKNSKMQKNTIARATQKHFEELDKNKKMSLVTKAIAEMILKGTAPTAISREVFTKSQERMILARQLRVLRAKTRDPQTKEAFSEALKRIEFNQAMIKAKKTKAKK
ncbi:MAG: hypothetical protein WC821_05305 [archaeon]|jgi:hypothetical protein